MMSSSSSDRVVESPRNFPATPSMALFPLSPGRVNRLAQPLSMSTYVDQPFDSPPNEFGHPELGVPGDFGAKRSKTMSGDEYLLKSRFATSPDPLCKGSALIDSSPKHGRASADVHAMVSRFNSLDIKDHADLRRKDAVALKRAQMGREEADAEVKKVREEMTALVEDMGEAKERERRVARRLDGVMEELHRAKEVQAHAQTVYEKEIRRARKEAFKSSSTLVKLQEELKAARNALRTGQSELELERIKVGRREQETFAAQYQLVCVQEELARAQTLLKTTQDECDILRTNLQETETQKNTAEGKVAILVAKEEENFYSNRKKSLIAPISTPETKRDAMTFAGKELEAELMMQSKKLVQAEEQIEFMKMECQFGCCSCRVAEGQGYSYDHDITYATEVLNIRSTISEKLRTDIDMELAQVMDQAILEAERQDKAILSLGPVTMPGTPPSDREAQIHDPAIIIPEDTLPVTDDARNRQADLEISGLTPEAESACVHPAQFVGQESTVRNISPAPLIPPSTPLNVRTVTTTTTVPLADNSTVDYSAFSTPTGLTREQAIEQLRQRRGRARSVASTPKKFSGEGFTPRRDVSAPDVRIAINPRSISRNRPR